MMSRVRNGSRVSFRYMVDAADPEKIEASKNELHNLLDKPQLQGIPVSLHLMTFHVFRSGLIKLFNLCVVIRS